jgi:hypothetical protein
MKTAEQGPLSRRRIAAWLDRCTTVGRKEKMKTQKAAQVDSLSPATIDFQYHGSIPHDTHFDVTDPFNTIAILVFSVFLILYSTIL